jgi:hypothetical protein
LTTSIVPLAKIFGQQVKTGAAASYLANEWRIPNRKKLGKKALSDCSRSQEIAERW